MPFGQEAVEASVEKEPVDASAKLSELNSALEELSSVFESSKAVSDKDRGRLESIKSQLSELQASLSLEPGSDPEDEKQSAPTGRLSPEAGNKQVKPAAF